MDSFYYMLEQVWLAHKEAGLETFVQVQLGALAVLTVAWVLGWVWAAAKTIGGARRRFSHSRSAEELNIAKRSFHVSNTPV
jgi:hypothetical protein